MISTELQQSIIALRPLRPRIRLPYVVRPKKEPRFTMRSRIPKSKCSRIRRPSTSLHLNCPTSADEPTHHRVQLPLNLAGLELDRDRRDDPLVVDVVTVDGRPPPPRRGGPGPAGQPRRGRGRRGVLQAAAQLLHHVALPAPPRLHLLPARAAEDRPADRRHGKNTT